MNLVLALQMLAALVMIGLVLIQHGKGADMGASFGSGASGSLFGATGSANFLSRSTAVCAAVFFVCTLALAYIANDARRGRRPAACSIARATPPRARRRPAGADPGPPRRRRGAGAARRRPRRGAPAPRRSRPSERIDAAVDASEQRCMPQRETRARARMSAVRRAILMRAEAAS